MTKPDPNPAPAPSQLLEAALYASDLDAAEAFYGVTLGLEKILRVSDRHVFFRVGSTVLLIFNPDRTEVANPGAPLPVPPHGARGPGHICLSASSDQLNNWRERLADNGIDIEADFTWPNGARSIYIRDPAGNSIEFAEPRLWF